MSGFEGTAVASMGGTYGGGCVDCARATDVEPRTPTTIIILRSFMTDLPMGNSTSSPTMPTSLPTPRCRKGRADLAPRRSAAASGPDDLGVTTRGTGRYVVVPPLRDARRQRRERALDLAARVGVAALDAGLDASRVDRARVFRAPESDEIVPRVQVSRRVRRVPLQERGEQLARLGELAGVLVLEGEPVVRKWIARALRHERPQHFDARRRHLRAQLGAQTVCRRRCGPGISPSRSAMMWFCASTCTTMGRHARASASSTASANVAMITMSPGRARCAAAPLTQITPEPAGPSSA